MSDSPADEVLSQVQDELDQSQAMRDLLHEQGQDRDVFKPNDWVYCPAEKWVGIVDDTDGKLVEVSTDQGIKVMTAEALLQIDPNNVFMQRPAARLRATYQMGME